MRGERGERGGFDVPKVGHGMVPGKVRKDNGALVGRSDANKTNLPPRMFIPTLEVNRLALSLLAAHVMPKTVASRD